MKVAQSLKLSEARELTPALTAREAQEAAARLQAAVFAAVSEVDVAEIIRAQVVKAKAGNSAACKTVFALIAAASRMDPDTLKPPRRPRPEPGEDDAPLPPPTRALPKTPRKLSVLEERATEGLPLHNPEDAREGGGGDEC
jgi:hypothetical protein